MNPIIEYANILQTRGVYSNEAKSCLLKHRADKVFQARARVLEQCFLNRDAILETQNNAHFPSAGSQPRPQGI